MLKIEYGKVCVWCPGALHVLLASGVERGDADLKLNWMWLSPWESRKMF